MNDLQTIVAMLGYRRPAGSKTERAFIRDWIKPLGVHQDRAGNLYKRIGDSPVLWSCHTDTVHRGGGSQRVRLIDGIATTVDALSNCLGADDTAGVWLMTEMIKAQKPGLYVFHRAEEIGGHGSQYIANKFPKLLEQSTIAIAFDRRGTNSIITHQWGGRCCSNAFAYSLGNALSMGHRPDSGGTFTDTANYMDAIAECTNLSVGYFDEHTTLESLDASYLVDLRDRLLEIDGRDLIVERKPGEDDPTPIDWQREFPDADQTPRGAATYDVLVAQGYDSLYRMIRDNPREVADMLEAYGIDAQTLASEILIRGGAVERGMSDTRTRNW
jgi:hypothetical protein